MKAILAAVFVGVIFLLFANAVFAQTKTYTNTDLKPAPRTSEDERVLAERAEAERKKTAAKVEVVVTGPESIIETERKAAERKNPALALVRIAQARCARVHEGDDAARATCDFNQALAVRDIVKRTKTVNLFDREVCRRFAGDNFVVMNACEERKGK